VLENVALAAQARHGSSFRFTGDAAGENAPNQQAMAAPARVGLEPRARGPAGHPSPGGERAPELALAPAEAPELPLLAEPMAGTGRDESERLIALMQRLKGRFPMVLVEHDMNAVFALADRISVLIYGRVLACGTPDEVRGNPQVVAAYLGDEMA